MEFGAARVHPDPATSPSASELFDFVLHSLSAAGFSDRVARLTAYFSWSCWFVDSLSYAPYLWLVGPRPEARFVMSFLSRVVPNPQFLSGPVTKAGLLAIDAVARPTLLIDDEEISGSALSLLRSTNYPDGAVWAAGEWRNYFCAKILYQGTKVIHEHLDHGALQVNLEPIRGKFLASTPEHWEAGVEEFRAKMFEYWQEHRAEVRKAQIDVSTYESPLGVLAQTFGAPFANEPALQANLRQLFDEFQHEDAARNWVNPPSVVIESLLFHCHSVSGTANMIQVGKIAETASAILQGRGEAYSITAKAVGVILRRFDVFPKRTAQGFALQLTELTRRRIHELAQKLQVPAQTATCSHCACVIT